MGNTTMAAMGGPDELIDLLRKTPVILRGLTNGLDDAAAQARNGDDAWSVVEVIGHLIDAERRAIDRVATIIAEESPVLDGYDQMALVERQAYRSRTVAELLAAFEMVRAERIAALKALDDAAWGRRATLSTYGSGSLREITIHMCGHDANHLAQIARLIRA
jgi:uncharacterized damage-inducible protein DinB